MCPAKVIGIPADDRAARGGSGLRQPAPLPPSKAPPPPALPALSQVVGARQAVAADGASPITKRSSNASPVAANRRLRHHRFTGPDPGHLSALVSYRTLMNSGEVYFSLRGESLLPNAVTSALGMEPTRSGLKAEPTPKASFWHLSSGTVVAEHIDVYELGESVVRPLFPHVAAIRELATKYGADVVLQVVLTISLDDQLSTPAIGFSKPVVAFLASVGASIDVDTYRAAV